jgi:hypothetical protein
LTIGGSTATNGLILGGVAGFYPNGRVYTHLFTAGDAGRANRKPSAVLTGAGPFTVRPDLYDTFQCSCSGAVVVNIDPAGSYVAGDTFRIVNLATSNGYTVTVKSASGTLTHYVLGNGFTNTSGYVRPNVAEIMRTAAGGWTVILGDSLA